MSRYQTTCLMVCLLAILVVSLSFTACNNSEPVSSLPASSPPAPDAYIYPILPGTDAWKELNSLDEMVEACQVPEEILKTMSIHGLVETVLDYPLFGTTVFFNNAPQGFGQIASRSNCVQELYTRADSGGELLMRYRSMDAAALKEEWSGGVKYLAATSFQTIELLLAQAPILDTLTPGQRSDLLTECMAKYQSKRQHAQVYSESDREIIVWLISTILQKENYAPFMVKITEDEMLKYFMNKASFPNTTIESEVISLAERFLADSPKD